MSSEFNVNFKTTITSDETSKQRALNDIAKVENANRAMISNIRQGVQVGIFAVQAMGAAVNQTISLLIESLFLSIEVALAIQAGTFGISTLLKGATVISMLILIGQLKNKKSESARRTTNLVSGLRMVTYR